MREIKFLYKLWFNNLSKLKLKWLAYLINIWKMPVKGRGTESDTLLLPERIEGRRQWDSVSGGRPLKMTKKGTKWETYEMGAHVFPLNTSCPLTVSAWGMCKGLTKSHASPHFAQNTSAHVTMMMKNSDWLAYFTGGLLWLYVKVCFVFPAPHLGNNTNLHTPTVYLNTIIIVCLCVSSLNVYYVLLCKLFNIFFFLCWWL